MYPNMQCGKQLSIKFYSYQMDYSLDYENSCDLRMIATKSSQTKCSESWSTENINYRLMMDWIHIVHQWCN